MPYSILHQTIPSFLVLVGFLLFVMLLPFFTCFNCFHSSSIWLFSSVTRSVSNFPNSSFSCCWNLLTLLASHSASTWSLLVLFVSYLLYAILHLYLPLTKIGQSRCLLPYTISRLACCLCSFYRLVCGQFDYWFSIRRSPCLFMNFFMRETG